MTENIPIQTGLGFPEKENFCGNKKKYFHFENFFAVFCTSNETMQNFEKNIFGKKIITVAATVFCAKKTCGILWSESSA